MSILLKNGKIINVFSEEIEIANVLIENGVIIGVGNYENADQIIDITGKTVCPSFIDSHIHIESTMLLPHELAKVSLLHGTTSIVTDPHEITNACGKNGIEFMLEASKNLPFNVFIMLPSCVPATSFDKSFATLLADDLQEFYSNDRVLGLAEMMNYVGTILGDNEIKKKISGAKKACKIINGHAPLLSGKYLDKYINAGISDDHECSNINEALEKLKKGMHVMIRQGTAAKNLQALLPLFNPPYSSRCMLATDDKHPEDLLTIGHIDAIVRQAISLGANPIQTIKTATLNPAEYYGLKLGAIAPGYVADLLVLDDVDSVKINCVYKDGELVCTDGKVNNFAKPIIDETVYNAVKNSFSLSSVTPNDFIVTPKSERVRVIKVIKNQLLTDEIIKELDFSKNNGIDIEKDILKIAVICRYDKDAQKAIGFVNGLGLKEGAIATSISHDSHNLITVGTCENDMAVACNRVITMGGGCVVVKNGKVLSELPLPIAGLMSEKAAEEVAKQNRALRESVYSLGVPKDIEPFMTTAFISLSVIPHIKITPNGLVDVDKQQLLELFV